MVSDQDIAKSVETLLRQSDPNAITTLNGVVHQLEANLGLDLSHKAGFIRDQINHLLRPKGPPKDHFALPHYQQFQNCHPQFHNPHFALQQLHQQQQQQQHQHFQQVQLRQQQVQPLPLPAPAPVPPPQVVRTETNVKKEAPNSSEVKKESAPAGTKRRGGPGGLNKVCGVSPELQVIVGEPALARTEIVKQLWAYIRKNNLQDPSNKRKIICDDALRLVFETDCTDMFKMNKLLAKHIIRLEPTKETSRSKKLKVDVEPATESAESGPPAPHSGPSAPLSSPPAPHSSLPAPHSSPPAVIISEALANFFGTGEREMLQSEALGRVWEYIKVNHLEDPMNSMVILCDAKLRELFGCESISALGISEILARHHLYRR